MARSKMDLKDLPLSKIDISMANVRKRRVQEGLEELAGSIKAIGLLQPVKVFQKNSRYELIVGQRRFLACKRLGMKKIRALVVTAQSYIDAILASFSENIYRVNLDYTDKMEAAMLLYKELRSVDAVARRLGVTSQTVKTYMGYAAVPDEIKMMVTEGKLGAGTAMTIAKNIPDEKKAIAVARKVSEKVRGKDKRTYLDAAIDNPDLALDEIDQKAEMQRYKRISVHLSEKVAEALQEACNEYKSDPADITKEALVDWLHNQGFFEIE